MRCPSCGSLDTQVKDSRPTEDSAAIRRRRVCLACNFRFTTFERVQLRELTVIKRNGRRVPFDRDKLLRSVQIALRKRPVEPERVERTVSKIVRELESLGENEITYRDDRRDGDGASARARRRGLCPVRLGLPQFPRGQGFRRRAGENCPARRRPRRPRKRANDRCGRGDAAGPIRRKTPVSWSWPDAGAARARPDMAQSGGRRGDGARRGRRPGHRRPGLDAAWRPSACRDRGARGAPVRRRAAPRSTSRSNRARITARPRPAPTPSSRPASPGWFPRLRIPIRRSRGRDTRGCAPPASRSRSGWAPKRHARVHAGHIRRVREGRPHVILKLAVSADGKAGLAGRRPVAITGRRRASAFTCCARTSDAVLIGIGTALADDPLLTCRLPGMSDRSPVRVVLDTRLRLPLPSKLAATARNTPALGDCRGQAAAAKGGSVARARRRGAAERTARRTARPRAARCRLLAGRGITRLMVEGGPPRRGVVRRPPIWSMRPILLRGPASDRRRWDRCARRAAALGADRLAAPGIARRRADRHGHDRDFRTGGLAMFTGIVTDIGEVLAVERAGRGLRRLTIALRL